MNDTRRFSKRSRRTLASVALAVSVLGMVSFGMGPQALAHGERSDHELARKALQEGKVLPLRTVLEQVERDYQGQVLEVEFERDDGRFIYELRVLQAEGRMIKLKVDAVDGKVLSVKQKRSH